MRNPVLALLLCAGIAFGQSPIAKKTAGLNPLPGLLPLYEDTKAGKLWMEISRWNTDILYYPSLPAGLGSNDVGLDRGQLGTERVVHFERHRPKVLLVQPNDHYRASADSAAERRSVQDSFAQSVLWGFEIAAEDGDRVLVDATAFFLRDAHGVIRTLARSRQGTYRLEPSRSAFYQPRTRNFPKNTEVEVILTFATDQPNGEYVRTVAPNPEAITLREHHSFVELPGPGYQPREFNPNSGYSPSATHVDYSTPLGETITKRYIARHRPPVAGKPIVYYLDPGAPEPIRSALLEGARWWSQAYDAAGFPGGFHVELLPDGADPMDVRYNMIQWVHRSTRGWSYGGSVSDPRTGEILKGHVTLGSLRVRQDYLIAESLLAPYENGKPVPKDMEQMALARLRQLATHEVGHTLGLAHNYIASAASRASVMDYPHPLVELGANGAVSLTNAYATGIGEWDKVAIRWGYANLDAAGRDQLLAEARARGLRFITDGDSRPLGSPHPLSHLWDSGANAVDELNRMLDVRRRALDRFGENSIRPGQPMSTIEDVLVPLYLAHRYQTEAAAKVLGGLDYSYALKGDGQVVTKIVPGAEQRRALDALLKTIRPEALILPERLLQLMPPRAFGYPRTRESFTGRTGLAFDSVAPAEAAANLTLSLLLHPERAARLDQYNARDKTNPSLAQVIDAVLRATLLAPASTTGLDTEIRHSVDTVVLYHLMSLAASETAPAGVRAVASAKLGALPAAMTAGPWRTWVTGLVDRFRKDPRTIPLPKPLEAPPGQPI